MRKLLKLLAITLIVTLLVVPVMAIPAEAAVAALHEHINTGGDANSDAIYGMNVTAQIFESDATAHTVTKVKAYLKRTLSPSTVTLSLYAVDAGEPTGDVLAYGTINGNSLPTTYVLATFTLVEEYALNAATDYAIVISAENGNPTNYV